MANFYGSIFFATIPENDNSYECRLCKTSFKDGESARDHFLIVHSKNMPFICDICFKIFNRQNSLTCHLRSHKNLDSTLPLFKCEKYKRCDKAFRTLENLHAHERSHEIKYTCEQCNLSMYRRYNYKEHLKRKHNAVMDGVLNTAFIQSPPPIRENPVHSTTVVDESSDEKV